VSYQPRSNHSLIIVCCIYWLYFVLSGNLVNLIISFDSWDIFPLSWVVVMWDSGLWNKLILLNLWCRTSYQLTGLQSSKSKNWLIAIIFSHPRMTLNLSKDHYIKMFTDLFCYSKKLLYSHLLALLRFCHNVFLSQLKRIYYQKNVSIVHDMPCSWIIFGIL